MASMLTDVQFDRARLLSAARQGHATATDLAEYLCQQGVPFRDAHEAVGRAVRYAIDSGKDLSELTLEELQSFHSAVQADVFDRLTVEGSVGARDHPGGTAPTQVRRSVAAARERIAEHRKVVEGWRI